MKGKNNIMSKDKTNTEDTPVKAVKKVTKKNEKGFGFGILGIGLALVVVSIAYSTVVIFLGTDGYLAKVMLIPQALFALTVLGYAFYKIFK